MSDARTASEIQLRVDAARAPNAHDKPDGDGPGARWTPYQVMIDEALADLTYLLGEVDQLTAELAVERERSRCAAVLELQGMPGGNEDQPDCADSCFESECSNCDQLYTRHADDCPNAISD